jgi:predicted lactoylglutathione lyase
MSKSIYVNLPVADVAASTRFYEALGCTRNPQFSSDKAACMVWSASIAFQLLAQPYFAGFSPRPTANAHETCQVLLALTCDSRAAVDAMAKTAGISGGKTDARAVMDLGWLYNRSFADPDGHLFEAVWIDTQAMQAMQSAKP